MISRTIDFLRLPLAILVIFIHNDAITYLSANDDLYRTITHVMWSFANAAVPAFFLISGLLYFRTTNSFGINEYLQKTKRRTKSLFAPYLCWNMVVYLWSVMIEVYKYSSVNGFTLSSAWSFFITDLSFYDILISWHGTGVPRYLILWFVRDLMVLSLLTPIIYYIYRFCRYWVLPILLGLYLFTDFHISFLAGRSIFWFCIGCGISILKFDLEHFLSSKLFRNLILALWFIMVVCIAFQSSIPEIFNRVFTILSVCVLFLIARCLASKNIESPKLMTTSGMFIYCTHILQPANKCTLLAGSAFISVHSIGLLPVVGPYFAYFITPFLTAAICMAIYWTIGKVRYGFLRF